MVKFPRFLILVLLVLSAPLRLYSQGDYDRYWYFGDRAGLDFATNPPTVLTNSGMSAFEGCATIADPSGVLQFYTNGSNVFNRNHTVMPNGSGLNGDGTATQTAIIVPTPQNPTQYYIFTVDTNGGIWGFNYHVVDMTQNGGLGDVTIKNQQLLTPVTEKLTAVRHANGIDAWVLIHDWNGSSFYAYLLTSAGLNTTPVISNTGTVHGGNFTNSHGYLKASSNAHKLACAIRGSNVVEVLDFNNITGTVSNPVSLPFTSQTYGVEFSPDNHYLYATTTANPAAIFQYDVTVPNPSIAGTGIQIATHAGFLGALQLGKDGKIYACQFQSGSLARIDAPTAAGAASGFTSNALFLGGRNGQYGLPNFLQSFFITADFTYADTCSQSPTNFTTVFTGPDSVKWNFGDALSGNANFSTAVNPQHTFSGSGQFTVELIVYQNLLNDTVRKTITILDTPDPDLGLDRSTCNIPEVLYPGNFPPVPPVSYLWGDGSTNPTFDVFADGIYNVAVTRLGCTGRDTVQISVFAPPVVDLGADQSICDGTTTTLDAKNPGAQYLWQDGSTTQTIDVSVSGTYFVRVSIGTCNAYDTIDVVVNPAPVVDLGPDQILCPNDQKFLIPLGGSIPSSTYLWNTGATTQGIFVDSSGTFTLIVKVGTCEDADTVVLDEQPWVDLNLGEDQYLCFGQSFTLDATTHGATYLWNDGSTGPTLTTFVSGDYYVTVTNYCDQGGDTIAMTFQECNCQVFVPNAFTPNGDPQNAVFRYLHACVEFHGSMSIYNRLGQRLFYSEDETEGWDGKYNGKDATEGVYIYEIKYRTFDSGRYVNKTLRETFMLLR